MGYLTLDKLDLRWTKYFHYGSVDQQQMATNKNVHYLHMSLSLILI